MRLAIITCVLLLWQTGAGAEEMNCREKDQRDMICSRDSLRKCDDVTLCKDEKVLKYAPALRFTSTERYFPTMPFFSAFDGVDNAPGSRNGHIDFSDPDEIAPVANDCWLFSQLRDWYGQLTTAEKRRVATAFYRVRRCSSKRVSSIIKSDGPRYYRLNERTRRSLADNDSLTVYEYYYYYLNDLGIKGHAEDIEMFYTYVPDDAPFLIMVGAAHSDGDANNVAIWEWADTDPMPLVTAFVELGGHAMAPDIPPHGELYRHGFDTNWHVGDAWGIRDVIAVGGEGSLKRYDGWKTEARDITLAMRPVCAKTKRREPFEYTYVLVSADRFFGPDGPYSADTTNIDESVARARASLKALLQELPVSQGCLESVDSLSGDGIMRMRLWTQAGFLNLGDFEKGAHKQEASHHIVVQHKMYRDAEPTAPFKPYLFGSYWPYPFIRRGSSVDAEPLLYVGGEIGAIPMGRARSWLNMQGTLRLGVGAELRKERLSLDLGYFTSTARRFTEYVQVGTICPDWRVAGGFIFRTNPFFALSHACFLELRGGVAFWHEDDLRFSKPTFEFSAALPVGGARQ